MSDPLAAMERALILSRDGPITVTDAARVLGIPGSTPGAKAQRLRRLEADGVLPAARRSLAREQRIYYPAQLAALQRAIRRPQEDE